MYVNQTNAIAAKHGDKLHYLVVYIIEPHPKKPDVSPYKGIEWTFEYSNYSQPRDYQSRVRTAAHVSDVFPLSRQFTVLVDDLTPHNVTGNNPIWCQWGPAPNAAWLLSNASNNNVALAQSWFVPDLMDAAISKLLDTA